MIAIYKKQYQIYIKRFLLIHLKVDKPKLQNLQILATQLIINKIAVIKVFIKLYLRIIKVLKNKYY